VDLEGGIDSANDLEKLGLPWLKAKLLYNKINTWKTHGLPSDFSPPPVAPHMMSHSSPVLEPSPPVPVQNVATTLVSTPDSSVNTLKLAADQGDTHAQQSMGVRYEEGKGVSVDLSEAARYYKLAANQGEADAEQSLGNCYYHGKGVGKDYTEAAQYYQLAANKGNAVAQRRLC